MKERLRQDKLSKVSPLINEQSDDSCKIEIAGDNVKRKTGGGRIRKVRHAVMFTNKDVEEDGAAEAVIDLGTAPRNKHMALLYYFVKLAQTPDAETNFLYIEQLLSAGADINARDNLGQSVLHEVARIWDPAVANFLIQKGAEPKVSDISGRTPLHISAAWDHCKMVECLLDHGCDVNAVTIGEVQTPLHYAAKNDASEVIKILHERGAPLDVKDYKHRTPLLLAAELDRSVAATELLECGAKAGIIDKTGQHTICAMVNKMPGVAYKALDQFHTTHRATRQQYFWLNYLEPDPDIDEASFLPMSVLGEVVKCQEKKLVTHPVLKEMIKVKWQKFGLFHAWFQLLVYILFLVAWSSAVLLYQPWKLGDSWASDDSLSTTISIYFAVVLYVYHLGDEVVELYKSETTHYKFIRWRSTQIRRDIQYVPAKQTEEIVYLESQIDDILSSRSAYLEDAWNLFDWVSYFIMAITIAFVLTMYHGFKELVDDQYGWFNCDYFALWTSRLMCITLITIWLKLFKFVRVFSFLGPFVVILANTIGDVVKILFVFVVFFVPTVCTYKHFFIADNYYKDMRETLFSVFRILLVDDYGYDDIRSSTHSQQVTLKNGTTITKELEVETWWVDAVVGYWLMFGAIIILNLFIALMSDTFQRVFDNAVEVALLERAQIIVNIESKLPEKRWLKFLRYIKDYCAPRIQYYDDDAEKDEDGEVKLYAQQTFEAVKLMQCSMQDWQLENREEMLTQIEGQNQQIKKLEDSITHLRRVLETSHGARSRRNLTGVNSRDSREP